MSRTAATQTLRGVRITGLQRLRNDPSGNPRWQVFLSDGTEARTGDGANCAYGIDNVQYRDVPLEVELRGGYLVKIKRTLPVVHVQPGSPDIGSTSAAKHWIDEGFVVMPVPQDQDRHPFGRPCRACSPEGSLKGLPTRYPRT
jgi:hypothetical protein